jgi:hypothetical protein
MSRFTGPLSVTHLDTSDGRRWRLNEPLIYEVGFLGSGIVITAPTGFITDGASVPRPLWAFLPPWGTYSRSVTLHDLLTACLRNGQTHPCASTWAEAAKLLRAMMVAEGTGQLIRTVIYVAVRLWAFYRDGNKS